MNPCSTDQTVTTSDEKIKLLSRAQSECSSMSTDRIWEQEMSRYIREETLTTLDEKIKHLSSAQSECMYRVNRHLRNVNPKEYEPEIVAIGPYHSHGDADHLQIMEDHKVRYLALLLKRKKMEYAVEFVDAIVRVESEARNCYAEPFNLPQFQFCTMLVLDGCFIIELVRKFERPTLRDGNDPIFQMDWIKRSLKRDLLLFENQVPYFVLCELYDLIEAPGQRPRLAYLLKYFFEILSPPVFYKGVADNEIKHLLSFIRHSWIPQFEDEVDSAESILCIKSATRLSEANVRFVRNKGAQLLDIKFEDGVMKMAPLTVEDRTESLFRNLIAYEQYCYCDESRYVSHYVKFLDCLIDSSKDVELLVRDKIIVNWLGDADAVAKMVNRLNHSVAGPGYSFTYAKIFKKANKHCELPINKWMAKLRLRINKWMEMLWRDYFNSPWRIISVVAALVLLLLTVTQTVFTILQEVFP